MEFKINLYALYCQYKEKARVKLSQSLQAFRGRYRRALGYKESEITETELYEELSDGES